MLVAVLLCGWSARALTLQADTQANPIRRVVTLLQDMQKEIEAEGEKEKDLFEKFMCYCDGNTDGMKESAKAAAAKITELQATLEAAKAEKAQIDQDLMQHGKDREAAKQDLAKATSVREKERKEFEAATGDSKENLASMNAAIAALEKGMGAKLLMQMSKASLAQITKAARGSMALDDVEKSTVLSFLDGTQNPFGDYAPQSGEIVGMLKAMKDEMDKDLNGAIAAEEKAQAGFDELAAAKKSEIAAASEAIEAKTSRQGALAVLIATTGDDVEDTTAELEETQAFLANLASQCQQKKKEWDARCKIRSEEVAAISEAIKVLNDDDALDLFKKTLSLEQTPAPSRYGFLQKASARSVASRVSYMLQAVKSSKQTQLALVEYALQAKAVDFSKVIAMIDNMVTELKTEQRDDDSQMAFCEKDLAKSEETQKNLESSIASSEALIEETKEASETTADEIAHLQQEIKSLDKAVAEASEQRKAEHADFTGFSTENNAAQQLLAKAKNKLFKFYRPNLHKEAPQRELTDEEKILASSGRSDLIATDAPQMIAGTTQTVYVQIARRATPPPPPETWGAYQKQDGKSNGVIALIENLEKELKDEMTEAKNDEETSQKDYERLMSESQTNRAQMAESITTKEAAKADLDEKAESTKELKSSQEAELMNTKGYISQLHTNCDFLMNNYDLRKAARGNEIESLANAKAVLSGAGFS